MAALKIHGMDLNISYMTINENNIDNKILSNSLIELYKNFDDEKTSYPLNLEPFKYGTDKVKFKKSLDFLVPKNSYILAHWYIYESAEYEITFSKLPKELLFNSFNGDKVFSVDQFSEKEIDIENQGTGDLIFEQTGFYWNDKGETKSKIIDVNLLDFNGKYTKSNKIIKQITESILSFLNNENVSKVTNVRRVILENSKTSISCDFLRDGMVISKTICNIGEDGVAVDTKYLSAENANKELDLMIKDVVGQGFEILWDG